MQHLPINDASAVPIQSPSCRIQSGVIGDIIASQQDVPRPLSEEPPQSIPATGIPDQASQVPQNNPSPDEIPTQRYCQVCQLSFSRVSACKRHIRTRHSSSFLAMKCGICGRSFSRKDTLDRHQAAHRKDGSLPCPICHKYFRKDYLKRHLSETTGSCKTWLDTSITTADSTPTNQAGDRLPSWILPSWTPDWRNREISEQIHPVMSYQDRVVLAKNEHPVPDAVEKDVQTPAKHISRIGHAPMRRRDGSWQFDNDTRIHYNQLDHYPSLEFHHCGNGWYKVGADRTGFGEGPVLPNIELQQIQQTTEKCPTGPPSEELWERHRKAITELCQSRPLKEVQNAMERQHGFYAT